MNLNMEWLRTFKTIYEKGTLTAAAQALYISQPGVSLHLNSLEAATGYTLFDRSAKKMVPTERAKVLYNFIQEPMGRLEMAEQVFHRSSREGRATISIGMCFETFQFTLERYISSLPFNVIVKFGLYPEMIHDLDKGVLDMIVTPEKTDQPSLEFKPFSKEKIVMVCGSNTNIKQLKTLLKEANVKDEQLKSARIAEVEQWLKQQIWYSTAADMEHLKRFWKFNLRHNIDFKPNYIVPNISSIVRCLGGNEGFAIIPDFLCRDEIKSGKIKVVWDGDVCVENTLYFGSRKKTIYNKEIKMVEDIFLKEMAAL
ncbi:LysR family transcriptional regulator [Chitinophaga flava]|uniref:LysR family transcriptional regulator n=1 Tax=Chitinophaga flava TaxID=2259036 RepID=A0A365Y1K9_9BACT|nr:LysR family transcriptional regulator [Chitinophaga flava]RBL92497.1 LysR family transcriptional regulator [Chitinophaga flava]